MLLGRHDYTTPSAPTAAWLDQVDAPFLVTLLEHVRPLALERAR
jgi:hypothetical protein